MRAAFGAALTAVCLVMFGTPAAAADVPMTSDLSFSAPVIGGTAYHAENRIGSGVRIGFDVATSATTGGRSAPEVSRRFRLESSTIDYFPFDSGFRLSFGLRRDRLGRLGLRGSDFRGDRAFTNAFGGASGTKRRLNPGLGLGYDQMFDKDTRLALDGGFRMARRDMGASQLMRLASASGGSGGLSGAQGAHFGPAVRLSLIHKF